MKELTTQLVSALLADATITAKVGNRVWAGWVDIDIEKQSQLNMPMVVVSQVSETQRTVPKNAKDVVLQVSIFSRNSYKECEDLAEEVIRVVPFATKALDSPNNTKWQLWSKEDMGTDDYEGDRRIWHKALRLRFWAMGFI